jgi:lipid A 3-O-deacylase
VSTFNEYGSSPTISHWEVRIYKKNENGITIARTFDILAGLPRRSRKKFMLAPREFMVTKFVPLMVFVFLVGAARAQAQSGPDRGGHELQLWAGGGHGASGSQSGDGVFNIGGRYGWILTAPHGPGFLRGRFEYAVDIVPVFLVVQRTNTAYGFGVNPFALKWNFAAHGSVVPYVDLGGGTLFTNTKVPEGTSHVNFTTSGALGAHFLRRKYNWSAEVRYMHISNAGISRPNPGINTIQVRLGFGLFAQPR